MSRAQWLELRGYPELPLWSMHIDSLLCYMAVASRVQDIRYVPGQDLSYGTLQFLGGDDS